MSERASDPESYLSEIDRRLESIEGELRPGRARPNQPPRRRGRSGPLAALLGRAVEPPTSGVPSSDSERPAAPPVAPEPASRSAAQEDPSALVQQVRAMSDLQEKLIGAIEDLIDACERGGEDRLAATAAVTVAAGPFSDTAALRAFSEQLGKLPNVREVTIRGFEGADRAVLEVQLDHEPPPAATP